MVNKFCSLDRIIGFAKVEEVIPVPVCHCEQLGHAINQHCQQTDASPDGSVPFGCHANVREAFGNLGQFPVQVVLPLQFIKHNENILVNPRKKATATNSGPVRSPGPAWNASRSQVSRVSTWFTDHDDL